MDTYVHVFLPPAELARFTELVDAIGREREMHCISVDPLVPLGVAALKPGVEPGDGSTDPAGQFA